MSVDLDVGPREHGEIGWSEGRHEDGTEVHGVIARAHDFIRQNQARYREKTPSATRAAGQR